MLRLLDHIQTSCFFSCAKTIKVKRKLTKQVLHLCFCNNTCFRFSWRKKHQKWNIDGHLRKKRKQGKKKIKNTSLCAHTSLFCHCISSASAEKDFIILPWKTAPSGSWQMNSLNCVDHLSLCLFMAYNKKKKKLIWNIKLNHPHIKSAHIIISKSFDSNVVEMFSGIHNGLCRTRAIIIMWETSCILQLVQCLYDMHLPIKASVLMRVMPACKWQCVCLNLSAYVLISYNVQGISS